jgi:hypothetical protein
VLRHRADRGAAGSRRPGPGRPAVGHGTGRYLRRLRRPRGRRCALTRPAAVLGRRARRCPTLDAARTAAVPALRRRPPAAGGPPGRHRRGGGTTPPRRGRVAPSQEPAAGRSPAGGR